MRHEILSGSTKRRAGPGCGAGDQPVVKSNPNKAAPSLTKCHPTVPECCKLSHMLVAGSIDSIHPNTAKLDEVLSKDSCERQANMGLETAIN